MIRSTCAVVNTSAMWARLHMLAKLSPGCPCAPRSTLPRQTAQAFMRFINVHQHSGKATAIFGRLLGTVPDFHNNFKHSGIMLTVLA